MNYYNEFDSKASTWLKQLIEQGLIPNGDVDTRSITNVSPSDLRGYTQCHFFAGIGGWSYALELAGWPASRPAWTGSPPCQPFSNMGKQLGFADPRDMWPAWFRLIKECCPNCIFGEQVDGALEWLDRSATDMESIGYAFAPCVIPAVAVGALQNRPRLFFAAHSEAFNGKAYDCMEACRARSTPKQSGGFSSMHLAGRWWGEDKRAQRLPILVRQFDGLSPILGGFGNAIVPQVGAQFIQAFLEAIEV